MPTNAEIFRAGLAFAKKYFTQKGYEVNDDPVVRDGVHFIARKDNKIYRVVVKSTGRTTFPPRWFEPKQVDACRRLGSSWEPPLTRRFD